MNQFFCKIQLRKTKKPHIFLVLLEKKPVANLDESGEGTVLLNRTRENLFCSSLSIDYRLLTDANLSYKWIVISFENRKLVTSRKFFLKHGRIIENEKFKNEIPIFLEVNKMNIHLARAFEAEQQRLIFK